MPTDNDKNQPDEKNKSVKSIWNRENPFGKFESKKIHKTKEDEEREKRELASKSKKETNDAVSLDELSPADIATLDEEKLKELKLRGRVPTIIKVVDFSGAAEGSVLKMTVAVRNYGDALARDVKVKCIGNARLKILTSPMAPIGDIVPRSKSIGQFAYEMPENYCEEYANFAVTAEAENAKAYSQLFTLKTGRRMLSASETMRNIEAEARGDNKKKPQIG
jgi:hypothetical protein